MASMQKANLKGSKNSLYNNTEIDPVIKISHNTNIAENSDDDDLNKSDSDIEVNINTYPLKITFIGNSSVGKTSIIDRFMNNNFNEEIPCTINAAYSNKKLKIDPFTEADLNIWDTAGQERFRSITKNYLNGSNGILIVFDLTNEQSFNDLDSWLDELKDFISDNKIEKILVGNKCDLPMCENIKEKAQKYADDHQMKYLTVSAKNGINIEPLFEILGKDCIKNIKQAQEEIEEEGLEKKDNGERVSALSGQFENKINEKIILDDKKENNQEQKTKKCC